MGYARISVQRVIFALFVMAVSAASSPAVVGGGSTCYRPSNTAAQLSGVATNTNWAQTGSCVATDTPSSCIVSEK